MKEGKIYTIPTIPEEEYKHSSLYVFEEASGSSYEARVEVRSMIASIPELPNNGFEAAIEIRKYLIQGGFKYDENVCCLHDVVEQKKGNCLGLTLLIGAVLQDRGFKPEYKVLLNPHDEIYSKDNELFGELVNNQYFSYDKPVLPTRQADFPVNRFAPLEHPTIVLDGRRFEVTSLDLEDNPNYSPEAEREQAVTFEELVSSVYIERAKAIARETFDYKAMRELCEKALNIWPHNREGWAFLREIAYFELDDDRCLRSEDQYLALDGDDSRFHYAAYRYTGDIAYLDRALKKYPSYLPAFIEKHVELEHDTKEAKFNLAVAAWCSANSSLFDLPSFYIEHAKKAAFLYGEEKLRAVLGELGVKEKNPLGYYTAMYQATSDKGFIETMIKKNLFPASPLEQARLFGEVRDQIPWCAQEFERLREEHQGSRILKELGK